MNNVSREEQIFTTQDIQLTASLYALGANLLRVDRTDPARCAFVLENSPSLAKAVEAYWRRQLSIEPQTLLGAFKAVKTRLYDESA